MGIVIKPNISQQLIYTTIERAACIDGHFSYLYTSFWHTNQGSRDSILLIHIGCPHMAAQCTSSSCPSMPLSCVLYLSSQTWKPHVSNHKQTCFSVCCGMHRMVLRAACSPWATGCASLVYYNKCVIAWNKALKPHCILRKLFTIKYWIQIFVLNLFHLQYNICKQLQHFNLKLKLKSPHTVLHTKDNFAAVFREHLLFYVFFCLIAIALNKMKK